MMKRFPLVLSILLPLLFLTLPVNAQHEQHHEEEDQPEVNMMGPGMMQMMRGMHEMRGMHGMHQQMMQNPMHQSEMMVFMLPALADTLGLNDQQVAELNQLKSNAEAEREAHREQRTTHREQMMEMFEGEDQPSTDAVRQHLLAMAEHRASHQAARYETAQQMRQVLTDEQRQMIENMTHQQKMRQMMRSMTMHDMMEMMQSMHGEMMHGGMMGSGMPMMQQGRMQEGGMQNGMRMQQHRQNR